MSKGLRAIAVFIVLVLNLMLVTVNHASFSQQPELIHKRSATSDDQPRYRALPSRDDAGFVIREINGEATCSESMPQDGEVFKLQERYLQLKQISHVGEGITAQAVGLKIILQGTGQLDLNPAAKQAFINAAARWEALIQNPITIIVRVDFGSTNFGMPWPSGVLGGTLAQGFGFSDNYPDVRSRLISGATSTQESALYNALPAGSVSTDAGPTSGVLAPSAVYRALGSLSAVADPATEITIGAVPSIGFNSAFAYDFTPDDGIDSGKTDFDAVAVHEMGHVLGFSSRVGASGAATLSILDVFRFRPGMSLATFPTAQHVLTVGGTHIFFAGGVELALSTGNPAGAPAVGDGRQASHWKDDNLSGQFIGIMDPSIPSGTRLTITSNDLLALDAFGFSLMGSAPPPVTDAVALTSGTSQPGAVGAPSAPGGGVLGGTQYSIQVPAGASELRINLNGNQDVDLFARFGARIVIGGSPAQPISDHSSESDGQVESIVVNAGSSPPLRQGTYFIAVGNFGPGAATYSVTAIVTTGGGGPVGSPPALTNLVASLTGNIITFTGNVADPDGDIAQAQSTVLNGANQLLGTTPVISTTFGTATSVNFTLNVPGLATFPSAVKGTLQFTDSQGNRSSTLTADFSQADSSGPTIKNATLSGSKFVIKGTRLAGALIIEVNGVDVTTVDVGSDQKAKVKGVASSLHAGDNRIRVRHGTLRSNIFVFTQ